MDFVYVVLATVNVSYIQVPNYRENKTRNEKPESTFLDNC